MFAFLLHRPPRASCGARRKAPHAISSNKENNAGAIEFSADSFNLVISEYLVLAATGERAARRPFISRFLQIFVGLLNQHESLSSLPHQHESRIIKTQGKHVTQKFLRDLKGLKSWGKGVRNPRSLYQQVQLPSLPRARHKGYRRAERAARQSHRDPSRGLRTTQVWPVCVLTG